MSYRHRDIQREVYDFGSVGQLQCNEDCIVAGSLPNLDSRQLIRKVQCPASSQFLFLFVLAKATYVYSTPSQIKQQLCY